jgi:ubiquinone/menaquinone biosynthesis C-methylase UbiE
MKKESDDYFYISGQQYDSMIKSRRRYKSIPFYLDQAKKYGSPVLELACGTGRITIPIAQNGLLIVGLDFSKIMLEQAKKKSEDINVEIEWIESDMTNFSLKRKFSTIIMPGAALNWVIENQDIENCLTCIKNHLNKNGRFIFDVFNPNLEILTRDPSKRYDRDEYPNPEGKGTVSISESNCYDKVKQINQLTTYYKINNEEIVKKLKLRMFFPKELDMLLHYNGFKIDQKYGSFDEEPFNSDSNLQIVVCQKK